MPYKDRTKQLSYMTKWRRLTPEQRAAHAAWKRKYILLHPPVAKKNNSYRRIARSKDPNADSKRARERERYRRWRAMTITFLGGCCARCGIADIRVLEIDHVEQTENGIPVARAGRKNGSDYPFFRKVMAGKIPKSELQVLCCNCHAIKTSEEDFKPYERRKTEEKEMLREKIGCQQMLFANLGSDLVH